MLEINNWFFVQLATFILLLVILNKLLFRPLLALFREREESTKGALEQARTLDREKDELLRQMEEKLAAARTSAREAFEGLSSEGMDAQRGFLEAARDEALEIHGKARADLDSAVEKARASLKADVDSFAQLIVEKLIGA